MNKQEFLYFNMLSLSYPCIFTVLSDIIISNYFFLKYFCHGLINIKEKLLISINIKSPFCFFFINKKNR